MRWVDGERASSGRRFTPSMSDEARMFPGCPTFCVAGLLSYASKVNFVLSTILPATLTDT
jgi:hypothetical protein